MRRTFRVLALAFLLAVVLGFTYEQVGEEWQTLCHEAAGELDHDRLLELR